jgi:hypothetical protein
MLPKLLPAVLRSELALKLVNWPVLPSYMEEMKIWSSTALLPPPPELLLPLAS